MTSLINGSKAAIVRLWRNDAPLTATAAIMAVALAASTLGLWLDPTQIQGAPAWLKPAKFALSIGVYCVTLAWSFSYIPAFARTRRFVGWTTAAAMLVELGIIAVQAARGTTSHFNVSSPLNGALFSIMGLAIVLQTLSTVAVAVALFRQPFRDRALGWGLRLGIVLTIAGAFIGGAMTRPDAEQVQALAAGQGTLAGSHTVGAPDGGAGVPVTGWSRAHGDLRVPHFLGLHSLQLIPLFALGLRRTRLPSSQRVKLVFTLAASYASFVGISFWQALRGEAFFTPGASTLTALVLWLVLTGADLAIDLHVRPSRIARISGAAHLDERATPSDAATLSQGVASSLSSASSQRFRSDAE